MRYLAFVLICFLSALPAQADELVINADTGVNVDAIVNRVETRGASSFATPQTQMEIVRRDIPERIIRISDSDRYELDSNRASALNEMAPAAGGASEPASDGGALGSMPLTLAEQYARGKIEQGSRP